MTKVELSESSLNGSRKQLYSKLRKGAPYSTLVTIADESLVYRSS